LCNPANVFARNKYIIITESDVTSPWRLIRYILSKRGNAIIVWITKEPNFKPGVLNSFTHPAVDITLFSFSVVFTSTEVTLNIFALDMDGEGTAEIAVTLHNGGKRKVSLEK
jgi:hypothetical protein